MSRKSISSINKAGNEARIEANFIELYAASGAGSASVTSANIASVSGAAAAASASAANAASAAAAASAAITTHEAAWATYTATCTAATGALTTAVTVGSQKTIGKTVFVRLRCTITAKNTGAGNLLVDLPATSGNTDCPALWICRDTGTAAGLTLVGVIATTTTRVAVHMLTSATPITNNAVIIIGGTYEKQ